MKLDKNSILEILKAHTTEMEGYPYYGSNPGIPEDDYDKIAEEIMKLQADTGEEK